MCVTSGAEATTRTNPGEEREQAVTAPGYDTNDSPKTVGVVRDREETPRELRLIDQREFPPPLDSWELDRIQDDYEAAALGWRRGEP